MSETSAESLRVPPLRPPSSISMLADRLKCSNLHDPPYDLNPVGSVDRTETMFMRRARRPKAVNFTDEEVCWINDVIPDNQRPPTTSSDVDASPITCDSGNEDSESWVGTYPISSSSRAPESTDDLPIVSNLYQPNLQRCLSTSAPDGPGALFITATDPVTWSEAEERKCCCFCQQRLDSTENAPSQQPPPKRSCRSQSVSSHQKLPGGAGPRRGIARPIALRIPQRAVYSPATAINTTASTSALSSTAHALVASGCVKLRNTTSTGHQLRAATSRLSWHHPVACGGSRRYIVYPGFSGCSRHSVVCGGTTPELTGEVKLRKPPSLASISTSMSNTSDFSHHRLSAFTPTTQSRRMSLTGDEGETMVPITAFSPDTVSSPYGGIGVPPSVALFRPTVSAASSGFFQDSCSLSHSSCSSSTNSDQHSSRVGNQIHHCSLVSKTVNNKIPQSDESTDSTTSLSVFDQQHHACAIEAKLRCQSQPACAAGAPTCGCGSVASAECLSRQVGLKRRRCSHDVDLAWESDNKGFLMTSQQHVSSFENASTSDLAVEAATVNHDASASPLRIQQQSQAEIAVYPQDSEAAFIISCCRKELSGLSEASEEEESNEAALIQHQHCCPLEEYDTGTLTPPPPQTRFRPIAPSPSQDEDPEGHHHHSSFSTEGSPCSFKTNDPNIIVFSDDEENDVDDDDSFGAIAPGLSHRQRCSPMQTEDVASTPSMEKYQELDINMIEQD
uniref:SH2 domain-containing protein n=1 Tax=Mesocestoides corti TaxID=53468 RepID=A0A5K3FSM7_MESCO